MQYKVYAFDTPYDQPSKDQFVAESNSYSLALEVACKEAVRYNCVFSLDEYSGEVVWNSDD